MFRIHSCLAASGHSFPSSHPCRAARARWRAPAPARLGAGWRVTCRPGQARFCNRFLLRSGQFLVKRRNAIRTRAIVCHVSADVELACLVQSCERFLRGHLSHVSYVEAMAPDIALGSLAHYSASATRCALALPRDSDLQAARHHGTGIWTVQGPTVFFGLAVLSGHSRIGCCMRAHDASRQARCCRKARNGPTSARCLSSGSTARICAPRRPGRSGSARTVDPSQSPASAQANPEANRCA